MWKLVRYQLRGRRLLYTIGLIAMGALTLYQATHFIGMKENPVQSAPISMNVPLMMALFWVLFYAVMTVINIVTYTQDLYGDTGYLVFSLPLRGAQVLGSRIVLLVLDTLMTLLGGMASVIILACLAPGLAQQVRPYVGRFLLTGDYWVMCLGVLAVIVSFMAIMFFGVTFGKTLTNSKKHLGSVFSALVVIAVLWVSTRLGVMLETKLYGFFYLSLDPFKNMPFLGAGTQPTQFPLVSPLMFVTLGVLAFVMTSWLMDRKLNL
jgi:ABC-2 type transport system permease protein